jgi:hypothetical protein
MKKKITLILAACFLTATTLFAKKPNDPSVPADLQENFSAHYINARQISWDKEPDYYLVSFLMAGTRFFAYYSDDASFMAIAHPVLSDILPQDLKNSVKSNYSDYWITDLYQVSDHHQPYYVIILENADQKIVLKSDSNKHWEIQKRIKKD